MVTKKDKLKQALLTGKIKNEKDLLGFVLEEKKKENLINEIKDEIKVEPALKGDRGPKGERGEVGETGPAGRDGKNGRDGRDGADGKDGKTPDTAKIALEASNKVYKALLPKIPTIPQIVKELPQEPEAVRDALEMLTGEDRLDKSAIRGLEELSKKVTNYIGGGSTARYFYQLMDVPQSYKGYAGYGLIVNTDETGLTFTSENENLWDRTGTTLTTHTPGDSVDLGAGTLTGATVKTGTLTPATTPAFDAAFYWSGAAYTDNTAASKTSRGTAFTLLEDSTDYFYFGKSTTFSAIFIDISTAAVGNTLAFSYWDGANWTALTVTDGTSALTTDGVISFTAPSDWTSRSLTGVHAPVPPDETSYFYVRMRSSTSSTTDATAYLCVPENRTTNLFSYLPNSGDTTGIVTDRTGLTSLDNINTIAMIGALSGATTISNSSTISTSISNITTTSMSGYNMVSGSLATSSVPVRYSPCLILGADAWNTTPTAASNSINFKQEVRPVSGLVPTGTYYWSYDRNGNGYSDVAYLSSTGIFTATSVVETTPTLLKLDQTTPQSVINGTPSFYDIKIPRASLGTPTYSTQNDYNNSFGGAGRKTGGTITDATGGYVAVSAGTGFIKATDDDNAQLLFFDFPAPANIAIPAGTTRYIGVEYNAGTPRVVARTTWNWNKDSEFSLGRVISEPINGTEGLHIISNPWWVTDGITNVIERFRAMGRLKRDDYEAGLMLSVTGTRNIAVTSGTIWSNLNEFVIPGLDTAVTGTFEYYWYSSTGGWQDSDATSYSATQYNDPTKATLQSVGSGKYYNTWVYAEADDLKIAVIYGQADYSTQAAAAAVSAPSLLPQHILQNGILIGRIIAREGVVAPLLVQSAFSTTLSTSTTTNHNALAGLQGGAAGSYYHLDATPYNNLYQQDQAVKTISSPTFAGGTFNAAGILINRTSDTFGPYLQLQRGGVDKWYMIAGISLDGPLSFRTSGGGTDLFKIDTSGNITASGTITGTTAKLSGLTDGYVPYHVADATGLANSPIYTDGTSIGIGIAAPLGKLHISTGASGQGTPYSAANELVIEDNADAGLSILTPSGNVGRILFGDESNASIAGFIYSHVTDALSIWANNASRINIASTGNVGIGATASTSANLLVNGNLATNTNWFGANWVEGSSIPRAYFGYDSVRTNAVVQGIGGKGIDFNVNNNTFGAGRAGGFTSAGVFDVISTATATNFISNVAIGTAPYAATSTTLNTNLNADLLDSKHVGTTGNTIPLLDGTNTWSGTQLFGTTTALQFRDSSIHIASLDDGHLDLTADTSIDLNGSIVATGKITTYNNVATEGMGVAPIIDYVALTAQEANIATTDFTNSNVVGFYRVSYYLVCTTGNAGEPSVRLEIQNTDIYGSHVYQSAYMDLQTVGDVVSGSFIVQNAATEHIVYATTSTGGTYDVGVYAVYLTLEKLN